MPRKLERGCFTVSAVRGDVEAWARPIIEAENEAAAVVIQSGVRMLFGKREVALMHQAMRYFRMRNPKRTRSDVDEA